MAFTDVHREKFSGICNSNKFVFSDRVVQGFFQQDIHIDLLLKALNGDEDGQRELEEKFRKYFFRVRFVKFLVSTIKYCTIDQMRLIQKNDTRNQLIFDQPVSEEGDGTLGEWLLGKKQPQEFEPIINDSSQFQASFANERLSRAFAALSRKQQLITTLCYALCYQDNEIARMIGVSPQAVCKTRNLALQKLRLSIPERR